MSEEAAQLAVREIRLALQRDLGDQLVAFVLYGSLATHTYRAGDSDINLLVVTGDEVSILEVRRFFRPLWLRFGELLKRVPLFTTTSSLQRHLLFNPLLAEHLIESSDLLFGQIEFSQPSIADILERYARMARQAMYASAILAPALLSEKEMTNIRHELKKLACHLFGPAFVESKEDVKLFARITDQLLDELSECGAVRWFSEQPLEPPPLLNNLQAIYEFDSHLVLIMSEENDGKLRRQITSIDWHEVAARITQQYRNIEVSTPSLLRLIVQYETVADYYLGNFIHAWGADPLADLSVDHLRVYRDLGRIPSTLQLSDLPHAYVSTPESDLAMLVHDFQNKLLNIRLRNELVCRMQGKDILLPTEPLPDRHTSLDIRIKSINDHLGWWANYYADTMRELQTVAAESL